MLGQDQATAMIAVKDLQVAKKFYADTLGLQPVRTEEDQVIIFKSGDSEFSVYRSDYAGTNKATSMAWNVEDTDSEVRELKSKGISFEHYNLPGLKLQGDVQVSEDGGMKIARFKDPDDNILSVVGH